MILVLSIALLSAFLLAVVPDLRKSIVRTGGSLHATLAFGPIDGWTSRQSSPWPIVMTALLCALSWAW